MSMTKTLPNHIIAVRMQNIFGQIRDVDSKVNYLYHTLMTKFPGHSEVLRSYGAYMEFIRDDLVKADELYEWADEIDNPDIYTNNNNKNRNNRESYDIGGGDDDDYNVSKNSLSERLSYDSNNSISKELKKKNSMEKLAENLLANKKTNIKKTLAMKEDKNKVSFDNGMGLQYLEKFTFYYYIIEAIIFTVISGIICIILIVYFWYFLKYYHSVLLTPYFVYQNLIDVYQITISSYTKHVNYWLNLMSEDLTQLKSIHYPLLRCSSNNIIISTTCKLAHLGDRNMINITKWLYKNSSEFIEEIHLNDARSRLINSVHTILSEYNKKDSSIISKELVEEEEANVLYNTVNIPDSFFPILKDSYNSVIHRLDVILYVIIIYVVMKSIFLIVSVFLFRSKIRLGHLEQHIGFDIIKLIPDYECERLTENFEKLLYTKNNISCEEIQKEKMKVNASEVWTLENNPSNPKVVEEKIKFFTQESYKCKTLKKKTYDIYWILFVEFLLGITLLLLFIFISKNEKQLVGALLYKGYRMNSINKIEYVIQESIKHKDDITKYNRYHKLLEKELNNLIYYQSCSSWHCSTDSIYYQDLFDLPSDIFRESYDSFFTTYKNDNNYYQRSLDSTINEYYRISFSLYNEERTKLSFNHPSYLMFKDLITNRNLHEQLLEIINLTDNIMFNSLQTLLIVVSAYFVVLFISQTAIYFFFLSSVPKNFIGDIIMIRFLLNHVSSAVISQYPIITRYTEATTWTNARINNYNDDDND